MIFRFILWTVLISLPHVLISCNDQAENPNLDDPQKAMRAHIAGATQNGKYPIFDGPSGQLEYLQFRKLHAKVKHKGQYFVSCADFEDSSGQKVDVDFIVARSNNQYAVIEAWLHKKGKQKRPYSL